MIPYASPLYFAALAAPITIATALGLFGRLTWRWVVAISSAMLLLQYASGLQRITGDRVGTLATVIAYGLFQFVVARAYLHHRNSTASAPTFYSVVLLSLSPLLAVKSARGAESALGFLGISYATFRALDVVIGIRDRLIRDLPFGHYATYLLFFPTMSSGPIDRYQRFRADLDRARTRDDVVSHLDLTVHYVFRGLLYKFILAALIKAYWVDPVARGSGFTHILLYMYGYAFYLFFDFAGYSAFAIGIGAAFGIRTPENFNRPFLATNIIDFWNRWHISLSTWFRDHVYMRLLMTAMRRRWRMSRLAVSCLAFYVTFVLMALWHGFEMHYLVYGVYHASLLAGYTVLVERRKRRPIVHPRWWRPFSVAVTFHVVCFGLLIFSGRLG